MATRHLVFIGTALLMLAWAGSGAIAYGVVELTGQGPAGEQGPVGPRGAAGPQGPGGSPGESPLGFEGRLDDVEFQVSDTESRLSDAEGRLSDVEFCAGQLASFARDVVLGLTPFFPLSSCPY